MATAIRTWQKTLIIPTLKLDEEMIEAINNATGGLCPSL